MSAYYRSTGVLNVRYLLLLQGEYRMIFDKTYACDPRKNNTIQFNIYFSKKTPSITELKGNVSSLIDFDDTLIVSNKYLMNISR